jgi:cytohesin
MKHILITTIAAVLVVGCGPSQPPEPPPAKAPDISIHDAAKEGNIEVVKQYLAAGTDVNATGEDGWSALHCAARHSHKEIVELLIDNGTDVNAKNRSGRTPLLYAVYEGHKEIIELLIANGADLEAKLGSKTPLFYVAEAGHKEVVELLIAQGADVNAKDSYGGTSLYYAAEYGRKEVVELLIANDADVNTINNSLQQFVVGADISGETALDKAVNRGHTEIADLLHNHGAKTGSWLKAEESIHHAVLTGNIKAVKQHLATGTDVNAKNAKANGGWTPLQTASRYGYKEIAELLIAEGADVNAKIAPSDRFFKGETPLDLAKLEHTEIADLLRKHGGKTGEELKAEGK